MNGLRWQIYNNILRATLHVARNEIQTHQMNNLRQQIFSATLLTTLAALYSPRNKAQTHSQKNGNDHSDRNTVIPCSNGGSKRSYNNSAFDKKKEKVELDKRRYFNPLPNMFIYNSKLGSSGNPLNLNAQAQDSYGNPIVCRHLAFEQLKLGRAYHTEFSTIKKIANNSSLKQNVYDKAKIGLRADSYCVFSLEKFGACLESFCNQMQLSTKITMLLCSTNHAMAITIKHKTYGFVIKFYDPNNTTEHKRVVCKDIQAIRNLKVEDLLDNKRIEKYLMNEKGELILAVYDKPEDPIAYNTKPIVIDTKFLNPDEYNLNVLFRYNDVKTLTSKVNEILSSSLINEQELDRLLAKDSAGIPGLYIALQKGYTEVVEVFCKAILESKNLDNNSKVKILTSKDPIGYPGLSIAVVKNHVKTVIAFVNATLNSTLTDGQKVKILTNKDAEGKTLLHELIMEGDITDAVIELLNLVASSKLEPKYKIEVLQAKNEHGCPALKWAIAHRLTPIVENYAKLILSVTGLDNREKLLLLKASVDTDEEISSLFLGMLTGQTDIVIILLKQLLHLGIDMATLNQWMTHNEYHGMLLAIDKDDNFLLGINKLFSEAQKKELFGLIIKSQQKIIDKKLNNDEVFIKKYLKYKNIEDFWKKMALALGKCRFQFVPQAALFKILHPLPESLRTAAIEFFT